MASPELNTNIAPFESIINSFRKYYSYSESGLELPAVSLVAEHDETIRFTNSTTSVMKPILLGQNELVADRTFLVQPAMGTQGINAWIKRKHLGRYASYFHSMGAIYPAEMGIEAGSEMIQVATGWGFNEEDLYFKVSQRDEDLIQLLERIGIRYLIDDIYDASGFSHTYGNDRLSGRNVNLYVGRSDGSLGQLTLIDRDETPTLFEVSFDSTPVVAKLNGLEHPIDGYPIQEMGVEDVVQSRIATDCAMISAALVLEGLAPSSRGKNGTLRKFFRTYVELVSLNNDADNIVRQLGVVAGTEVLLREISLLGDFDYSGTMLDTDTLAYWIDQFKLKH